MSADFDVAKAARHLSGKCMARLEGLPGSEAEREMNQTMLYDFIGIAAQMLTVEQVEITADDGEKKLIATDEPMIKRGLLLFSRGLVAALKKCMEKNIAGELKKLLLQNLALDLYKQVKLSLGFIFSPQNAGNAECVREQMRLMGQCGRKALRHYWEEHQRGTLPVAEAGHV